MTPEERLKGEVAAYLDYLNGSSPLDERFQRIKDRIVTLACMVYAEERPKPSERTTLEWRLRP